MRHYDLLKGKLERTPILKADAATGDVDLVSQGEAMRLMLEGPETLLLHNALGALEGWARLPGVGFEDRTFTLHEIGSIAGLNYNTAHDWVKRGILVPSLTGRTGGHAPMMFTWGDAFASGLIGTLRRKGLPMRALLNVQRLLGPEATETPKEKEVAR